MSKYLKHYNKLIRSRKELNRAKDGESYYEEHHILPKSLGGDCSADNLILLTGREHFIAHKLLFKHYNKKGLGAETYSMALAFAMMSKSSASHKGNRKCKRYSSKTYEEARKAISSKMSGKGNPMYGRPPARKGKKVPEEELIKAYNKRREKDTLEGKKIKWFNKVTDECIYCTAFQLRDKYPELDLSKLNYIVKGKEGRAFHKNWGIENNEVNTHEKVKESNTRTVTTWFNMEYNIIEYDIGAVDLAKKYNLNYKELLCVFNNNSKSKVSSYKEWTNKFTYDKRSVDYVDAKFTKFIWQSTLSDEIFIGTAQDIRNSKGGFIGKYQEVRTGSRLSHNNWRLKGKINE